MEKTIILCKDFREIVEEYDSEDTLFYFDPPYESSNNISNWDYAPLVRGELLDVLRSIKGNFVLTYEHTNEIVEFFKEFNQQFLNTTYTSSNRSKKTNRMTELVITNF